MSIATEALTLPGQRVQGYRRYPQPVRPDSSGHYPSAEHAPQGAAATWLSIDPLLLSETTDADK